MAKILTLVASLFLFLTVVSPAEAQELIAGDQGILRARVLEVLSQERRIVPGTDTETFYQTIQAEILEGDKAGQVIEIENDFLTLREGDKFFAFYLTDLDGTVRYSVRDIDRRVPVGFFVALFIFAVVAFGGRQGLRSLLSLAGSFFVIIYLLVPSLLNGYPPVFMSILIAAIILFFAIFVTHGFNRESLAAFAGTVISVVLTGVLAYVSVDLTRLTGFSSEESIYLNFNTRGLLDFSGLLLGGIMIGVLGVLDDIAVTQAAVVTEIYNSAGHLTKKEIYKKALRVGREHVSALVNTLALAYTGASLPLLLLFSTSESSLGSIINQEVFSAEIIRIVVGSIGLIMTVPITTLLAVYLLKGGKRGSSHGHFHKH